MSGKLVMDNLKNKGKVLLLDLHLTSPFARAVFMRLMYYEDYSSHGCWVKYFTQVINQIEWHQKETNKCRSGIL